MAYECTGLFTDRDKAALHLQNGSKRVLISAPGKDADRTIVYGVNHMDLTADDVIVSNASCTTNCLAPVAMVLDREFGIKTGYMTTIHSFTGDQPSHDTSHKDLYRGRAASLSMVPTSTGAARAISLVLPQLKGKLEGSAVRVPTPNVSLVDLSFMPGKPATREDINAALQDASRGELQGILAYEEDAGSRSPARRKLAMTWKIFSLLTVTVAFLGLVVWVYLPRNKERLNSYGSIPLEEEFAKQSDRQLLEEKP